MQAFSEALNRKNRKSSSEREPQGICLYRQAMKYDKRITSKQNLLTIKNVKIVVFVQNSSLCTTMLLNIVQLTTAISTQN